EYVSEVKGMFHRCLREDQWDWQSVCTELGQPPKGHQKGIAIGLADLRGCLQVGDERGIERARRELCRCNILNYLSSYLVAEPRAGDDFGWIYVLSTREQPTILKIGKTTRAVHERASEINRATGVLIPYGARRIFRVANPDKAERDIFALLAAYRVRNDR